MPTRIRSVSRAATILKFVAREPAGRTATETAHALDIPLPTAYHLLNTLVGEGMLAKETRRYRLGAAIGLLAEAFLRQVSAPETLVDRVRELADRTGDTAYLSAWRGADAVVLSVIEGRRAVRVAGLHVGYSGAAHARASGKVLLAFGRPGTVDDYLRTHGGLARTDHTLRSDAALRSALDRTRRAGYAVDEEEFAEGVACIAAPVADGSMAIGISTPVERFRERKDELIRAVVSVAATTATAQLAVAGDR